MSIVEHTSALSLDATIDRFLRTLEGQGMPPLHTLAPAEARAMLAGIQTGEVYRFEADTEDCTIAGGPGGPIALRILRPRGESGPLPAVLYFHGGGWIMGNKDTHDRLIRELATGAQVTVVFVEYARSPELQYPVAVEQAYAATQWVAINGASIKVVQRGWR